MNHSGDLILIEDVHIVIMEEDTWYQTRKECAGRYGEFMQQKKTMHCEHCGMIGHTMSTCFKIHGYPNWYKELKQNKNNNRARVNMVTNELDSPFDREELVHSKSKVGSSNATQRNVELSFLIQQEVAKYMQDKNTSTHSSHAILLKLTLLVIL